MLESKSTKKLSTLSLIAIVCALASQASAQEDSSSNTTPPPESSAPAPAETSAPADTVLPTIPVAEAKPEAPAADKSATQLEDIVVTATKRAIPLRDIAASIDVFSGAKLESEGKINLADYIETKPGVTISNIAPNLLRITVRGIQTDIAGGSAVPSATGVFIGDTAFSDPYIANIQPDFNAFDLSTVEILKGPQGTLFGGSALAGAIRFVMQEPVLGTWQTRGFSQYDLPHEGSPALSSGVVLNAPVGDTFAARLGYMKREYPAIYDNSRTDSHGRKDVDGGLADQYRGLVSWRPLTELGLKFTHLQQNSTTPDGVGFADNENGPRENNKKILPQPSLADFSLDSAEIGYDFDSFKTVFLASKNYKSWDAYVDGTAALYGTPQDGQSTDTSGFSTYIDVSHGKIYELRLQSTNDGPLTWLGGLYYFDYKVFFEVFIDTIANQQANGASGYPGDIDKSPQAQATSLLYAASHVTAHERAAFTDISYKFFDRLDVSGGARYYETEVKGGFHGTGALAQSQNNGQDIDYSGNDSKESGINPKLSAALALTRNATLWAGASRGFRFGGLQNVPSPGPCDQNGCDNVPAEFKSDILWSYELGLRSSWLENTLHFDTTLFFIDWTNPQLSQGTTHGVVNYGYTDNVSHAISQGFETALSWLTPLDGVRVDLSAGLTDAHTTEDFKASGGTVVPAGSKMPGAADYQYSAALAYLAPPIGIFNLGAHIDYTYVGTTKGDIKQVTDVNDYGTLNGGITLTTLAWRFKPELSFNVVNVLDTVGLKFKNPVKPVISGNPYSANYLNAPRTFSVRLGFEF